MSLEGELAEGWKKKVPYNRKRKELITCVAGNHRAKMDACNMEQKRREDGGNWGLLPLNFWQYSPMILQLCQQFSLESILQMNEGQPHHHVNRKHAY